MNDNQSIKIHSLSYPNYSKEVDYFLVDPRDRLVDANIHRKEILKTTPLSNIYTVIGVDEEAGQNWGLLNNNDHVLNSFSINDIRKESGILTLISSIGEDNNLISSTITFNSLSDINCDHCGSPLRGTITNEYSIIIPVCQRLSKNDQRLLVCSVALPGKVVLITNDSCLGRCSSSLDSLYLEKEKLKYWKFRYNPCLKLT